MTTLAIGGRQLPSAWMMLVLSFLDGFDLLPLSVCSRWARGAVASPDLARALVLRSQTKRSFLRALLTLSFFASQQPHNGLLSALCKAVVGSSFSSDHSVRESLLGFLQLCNIAAKFPNDASVYSLTDAWLVPRTLAAAWLNDIAALKNLVPCGLLEPNVHLASWPGVRKVTPVCRATTEECLRFLLQHGADACAEVRADDAEAGFCVLDEVASQCQPTALRVLLPAGEHAYGNLGPRERTVVERVLDGDPLRTCHLADSCSPSTSLWRTEASRLAQSVQALFDVGVHPFLGAVCIINGVDQTVHFSTYLVTVFPDLVRRVGRESAFAALRTVLRAMNNHSLGDAEFRQRFLFQIVNLRNVAKTHEYAAFRAELLDAFGDRLLFDPENY